MNRPYSHQDPSPERTGEWDSPSSRTRPNSPARHRDQGTQLVHRSSQPVVLSTLKQEVLPEDEYLAHLSSIIQRDFFPHLRTLEQRNDVLDAFDSRDPHRIEASVRALRDHHATPTPRRRAREGATPYSTRESARGDLTPTFFDRTPLTSFSGATPSSTATSSRRRRAPPPPPRVDPHISLDAFQARYTSQDNASFQDLLASDNAQRRTTHAWAFDAEGRANARAVRGRQARERLVDVTRRMVDASGDGSVRLVEGPAGRPGERRLVVDGGVEVGKGERLLVTGRDEAERLLITDGADKGKGREREGEGDEGALVVGRVDESARQFVDYDKATADEEDDARPVDARELQVQSAAWPFKTRNSFMFPPDADRSNPSSLTGPPSARTATAAAASSSSSTASSRAPPILIGEPKGVRHAATRLEALERGSGAGSSSARSSFGGGGEGASEASLSPSRSRIGAAIAGTPYPSAPQTATPRVGGFSFVDALPTLPSAALPPHALQELMTWGTIEATPVVLRAAEADAAGAAAGGGGGGGGSMGGPGAVGPFRVREADRREELAHRMARRAKRSLAESGGPSPRGGLALGGGGLLRRSAVEASVRGGGSSTPGGGGGGRGGGGTPSASARADALSPAARSLLGRTKPGRALEAGLGRTEAWREKERSAR
ncbi:uncharacterized protein RHOBADRAFT_55978 [Rhodotorula graminis WP1]|uniref:Nuclear protein Es2 n=1 Tax=Rhodotorula graminis (strain WP1) TaxID=578459 RepID=A0A0P9IRW7_RHOGW|nr:uncharacterized protein RHOBADRAFT_55978 [Rhodotorula graminis WP1]KPV72140.1 hypothetical protein RHOBADRAFT_55978 [Rhodotorula graminis WP1]